MWPTLETVPAYSGRQFEIENQELPDEAIQEQLDRLREQFAELDTGSRPSVDGDFVAVNLSATKDGQPLEAASASDLLYEVGSNSFIDGLDGKTLGRSAGDIEKFETTLPAGFGDLGGTEVSMQVLIKEVKEKIITDAESLGVGREVVVSIMEKIQGLLNALSKGDIEGAEGMLMEISTIGDKELFSEVGKITRNLHNAISEFKTMIDPTLKNMALEDMPDAADKLNWVISKTEEAAEKTISLVEKNLSLQGGIVKRLDILDDALKNPEGDNEREKEAITFLRRTTEEINVDLMDVLLTQEYQDLTGQIIRKVISLVSKLEIDLVQLIKAFGVRVEHQKHGSTADSEPPEETFSSQEDVDTLLTELGF